jgi:ADP-ribosyl-[dinitrogen reductase] hydrolase
MPRTSTSHPIRIAEVRAAPDLGRIGITFCPGKKDRDALSGAWDRDVRTDVEAIREWGAHTVVTLIEDHEFELLQVRSLASEVRRAGMDWMHLPIRDVSVPSAAFQRNWIQSGEALRSRLRRGLDIVVHCRGGLGRAGTIAAVLLVELGMTCDKAIEVVRQARPGAIETAEQERVVRMTRVQP